MRCFKLTQIKRKKVSINPNSKTGTIIDTQRTMTYFYSSNILSFNTIFTFYLAKE